MSPNEQQPAYIPPSLTGQGVQAYMPSNTNPMPGIYVPPPPDVPAWQQAQHAPLQGGIKKFRYTKPTVDPSFYAQGYQGVQPMQPQQPPPPPGSYAQSPLVSQHPQQPVPPNQYVPHGNMPLQPPPPMPDSYQPQQAPYEQQPYTRQMPYGHSLQDQSLYQQQPNYQPPYDPNTQYVQSQYEQQHDERLGYSASNMSKPHEHNQQASNMSKPYDPPQASNMSKPHHQLTSASNVSKPFNDNAWQVPIFPRQDLQNPHVPSTQWQAGHNQATGSQGSLGGQQYVPLPGQDIEAPKPLARTDTAPSNFFDQPSPQSQPVSPVNSRHSIGFGSGHQAGLGRAGSVSSIALANLHAQREGNRTSSPKPPPPKLPTPPPPRDDKSKFSVLGSGGPSDWEHFGDGEIDDEEIYAKKSGPAQLDSVELPASQPEMPAAHSPPPHGWPSPASHPMPRTTGAGTDTYEPTPPPAVAHLAEQPPSQTPQRTFTMGDAAPAPLNISAKPVREGFGLGDGARAPSKHGTPVQHQSLYQPPPAHQGFVMDEGGWSAQPVRAPVRQQTPTHPPLITGISVGDTPRDASQQTPAQKTSAWTPPQTHEHAMEIHAREETIQNQGVDFENRKTELLAEIEKLKVEVDVAKTTATDEKLILQEQIEAMKTTAAETKTSANAILKEKDLTIERMKEDVEGKEHNIDERNATITELRRQLEAEMSKETVKIAPLPSDLIPELDPWYAGSLERYIVMLRNEAKEPQVEDKIRTFRAFLRSESDIRGIPFYEAPSAGLTRDNGLLLGDSNTSKSLEPKQEPVETSQALNISKPSTDKQELSVRVPRPRAESPDEEDYEYSPGGRPLLKRKATMPSSENAPTQQQYKTSTQPTTILTPTSSVDDDSNRTPVQSPPEDQSMYKAYVPPALFSGASAPPSHDRSVSDVSVQAASSSTVSKPFESRPAMPTSSSQHHDEIFFGAQGPSMSKPTSRPSTGDSAKHKDSAPAPLAISSHRSASTASSSTEDATEALADLLPSQISPATSHHLIEKIKTKLRSLNQDSSNLDELTKEWEKTAAVIRKKLDQARRARQEENEEDNNDAFDNEEISYAALKVLEDEIKQKENALKAQEDRDEYKSYVEAVFDNVYDTLQSDIKALMDLYLEAETLLHHSVSGVKSLEPGNDAPSTQASLELIQEIHNAILTRQDAVVAAVAERDKRYKKTEIAPLYAAKNMAKMRTAEQHFENAEKQAHVRALRDRAGKVGELVAVVEDVVVDAVGVEQREIDSIVSAMRDIEDGTADAALLSLAQNTLTHLKASSTCLLRIFNSLEIAHNAAVLDAEIAQAKAEGAETAKFEDEKAKGEKKFMDEFQRRVEVIERDREEIEGLVEKKRRRDPEEVEREKRLKAALEEAKRRNGHV
jgi:hypothetical protein